MSKPDITTCVSRENKRELLKIVCRCVQGLDVDCPSEEDQAPIARLAAVHGVANILYYAVGARCCENVREMLLKSHKRCRVMEAKQTLETENLIGIFEEKGIRNMVLKGTLIRPLYPTPDMRYMSDVDILIDSQSENAIDAVMKSDGFERREDTEKDINYIKMPFLHYEFHKNLVEEIIPSYDYYKTCWQKAALKEGCRFTYTMKHEDFYIYSIVHLMKHFIFGGVTIRALLDEYLFLERYGACLDWEYIKSELEKLKLTGLEKNVRDVCGVVFYGRETTPLLEEMIDVFLDNFREKKSDEAVFSVLALKSEERAQTSETEMKLRRFFPKMEYMRCQYPVLKKFPFLLPVMWVVRLVTSPLRHKNLIKREREIASKSTDESEKLRAYYQRFGIGS